jgi:hypothetical protein
MPTLSSSGSTARRPTGSRRPRARWRGTAELPLGRHNVEVMAGPEPPVAFEHYVQVKRELLELLEEMLPQDNAMLEIMRGPCDTD